MKALVTGAGSGLGREISYYLDNIGYELILVGREKKELEITKKNCSKATIFLCDLSDIKQINKLYEANKNIDFLVNNAGFGLFGNFYETNLDTELNMIDVNIKAVHILCKLYLSSMIKKNNGYILNIASVAGFMSGPKLSTYYATKSYIIKLSTAINEELRNLKSKVQISVLCPGPFDSKFNQTAGSNFINKGLTSKQIAKIAVDQTLKNKMIIIPGLKWKVAIFLSRFISNKKALKIIGKYQNKKQL